MLVKVSDWWGNIQKDSQAPDRCTEYPLVPDMQEVGVHPPKGQLHRLACGSSLPHHVGCQQSRAQHVKMHAAMTACMKIVV